MRPTLAKYEILGRIASGGMADVWLARARGAAGFEKLVALKSILPAVASEPHFTEMFIEEARLAAKLSHPNCVQIYDLGHEEGIYYIAMEFIDGFSFSRVLKRAEEAGPALAIEVTARIVMDAASGLDYAHRLADRDGTPLRLVHRDVSPDNVLVDFSGQTKLADFGIAKALSSQRPTHTTRTGHVKGKCAYMAPEYLRGEPIDGRADLFGLGVVLYRALTGSKPFNGATDALIMTAILEHLPKPPSSLNGAVPEALEAVVQKALAKDPTVRFDSGRAMRAAIAAAVKPAEPEEVGAFMESLWPPADEERSALRALTAVPPSEVTSNPVLESITPSAHLARTTTLRPPKSLRGRRGRRRWLVAGVAFLAVAVGAALLLADWRPQPEMPPTPLSARPALPVPRPPEPEAVAAPSMPPIEATGKVDLSTPLPMEVFWRGNRLGLAPGVLELEAGRQRLHLVNRDLAVDRDLVVEVVAGRLTRSTISLSQSWLEIRVSPWAEVKLDGRSLGITPLPPQKVYEGRHTLELSNPELGRVKRLEVRLGPGERKIVREALQ